MKNIFKVALGATLLTASAAMAAPQYPFKSYTYPHGNIIKYGNDNMIKEHFAKWKQAWMKDVGGQTYILAPEGECSTVSEAIAYGMMIMVFMDDGSNGAEQDFAKLYNTWKQNGGNGGGMNWRIGCSGGTGSATDADMDAALALAMAGKQWNNATYTNDAKTIASWIAKNDIDGSNKIKPGNQWNDAFNPSYATVANFHAFKTIGASGNWDGITKQAFVDLKACQNSKTGLVPDWCDWNGHQPVRTSASVQQGSEPLGLYDDAARTYWRTAWDYYWYGSTDSKNFNATLTKWLYDKTRNSASNIIGGYELDGSDVITRKEFGSSTFSGGLGFAAASDETDAGKKYIESVYSYLSNRTSCVTATGCGEGVPGEKYYPATLNILYLLLITGHMPNFLDMNGFTEFTPDTSLAPGLSATDGEQMAVRASTVGVSGFWNWGAYHDKYNIGTEMSVDSGASPLFYKSALGQVVAEASMKIGPEPEWTAEAAAAGTLKYPSAGIAMSFLSDDSKGVDLSALGVVKVRVTAKVTGNVVRMAVLNEFTAQAGAEPGVYLAPSDDYKAQEFDLTPEDYGFKGFTVKDDPLGDGDYGGILSWIDKNAAPEGAQIIKAVKGLKFEVKDKPGGIGDISISKIEFLDASGNVIDPVKITNMPNVGTKPASASTGDNGGNGGDNPGAIGANALLNMAKISTSGLGITVSGAPANTDIAVFNMQGKIIATTKAFFGMAQTITVPNKGVYMVRVGNKISKVAVK